MCMVDRGWARIFRFVSGVTAALFPELDLLQRQLRLNPPTLECPK